MISLHILKKTPMELCGLVLFHIKVVLQDEMIQLATGIYNPTVISIFLWQQAKQGILPN